MIHKTIPVTELRVGMYVAHLDRPWLGTPFAFQGFPVTSQDQIEAVREYCKFVTIDLEQDLSRAPAHREAVADRKAVRGTAAYGVEVPVEKELTRAKAIYGECEIALQQTMQRLLSEGEFDSQSLRSSVNEMTESVLRNPDAMTLIAKLKTKDDHEFRRAVDSSILMISFGRFLQLAREEIYLLGLAGFLLDVGKIRVADAILKKAAPLTPEENEAVKKHVMHSVEILSGEKGFPQAVVDVVLQHHEYEDGSGYPRGLRKGEITLFGSIAAIVDSYCAMISPRPYAEQYSPSNALGELYKRRDTLYHAALIEQFIQCIGIYPVGSAVELNSGEIGVVISQNLVRRLQPRVMVILDRDGKVLQPQKILDLIKEPKATADEPYRIRRTLKTDALPVDVRDFFL
ncbi:MAG: DUF3391 domain-containing protein [Betaproteobacteria bacterium]|nr:DUF3391 domain-containing protein [Betaproteobacteria bacterium]